MRPRIVFLSGLALLLAASTSHALVDSSVNPETVFEDVTRKQDDAEQQGETVYETRTRMIAEARARAERLRNLPPEDVQALISGQLSESEVLSDRRAPAGTSPATSGPPPLADSTKASGMRIFVLLAIGAACAFLMIVLQHKRRLRDAGARKASAQSEC